MFTVYEINPNLIIESEIYPDSVKDNFIFDHLKRYCSKFDPLPAITAKIDREQLVVTEGHKYLRIAKELNRDRIRTVILSDTDNLLREAGIEAKKLPIELLRTEQNGSKYIDAWHVIFVRKDLESNIADVVQKKVCSFIDVFLSQQYQITEAVKSSSYNSVLKCLEFKFTTPVEDITWANQFFSLLVEISQQIGGIESYQGRKFTQHNSG